MNYLELIPEMYRNSQVLRDYVSAIGQKFDLMQENVGNIYDLINPSKVPIEYIQRLADLLNLEIYGVTTQSERSLRNQVIQAVDWYKIKGTYQSLINVAYLFNLNCQIKDLYTADYINFLPADWFVGQLGVNPDGVPSNYYKSPHFGCYFQLTTAKLNENPINSSNLYYLWKAKDITDLSLFVEKVRPVNTVPHYTIQLTPITKVDGLVQTIFSSKIKTQVYGTWNINTNYYDSGIIFDFGAQYSLATTLTTGATSGDLNINYNGVTGTATVTFSNGDQRLINLTNGSTFISWSEGLSSDVTTSLVQYYDQSLSAFLSSITHWKLGIGNKAGLPGLVSEIVLADSNVVLVDQGTYYEFRINIPSLTVQAGISELGLYDSSGNLFVATTFPDIDKTAGVDLYINIIVNKE